MSSDSLVRPPCPQAFDWVFHNPFCNALFRCGCTWNWDGGWARCNVHNTTGPRCPWCAATDPFALFVINDWTVVAIMVCVWLFVARRPLLACVFNRPPPDALPYALLPSHRPAAVPRTTRRCGRTPILLPLWARLLSPAAAFTVYNFCVGLVFFLASDYPYFVLK